MLLRCRHAVQPIVGFLRTSRALSTSIEDASTTEGIQALATFTQTRLGSTVVAAEMPPIPPPRASLIAQTNERRASTYIPPDTDPLLTYFTSLIQKHGEKQKAQRLTTKILEHIHLLTRAPPLPIFREAIFTAAPTIRIVNHRQGPKKTLVPTPLSERGRARAAIQWILEVSKKRPERTAEVRVAKEMILILQGGSAVLDKKLGVHKLGVANRSSAMNKR